MERETKVEGNSIRGATGQRILRYREVASETGMKKTLFYSELNHGYFPSGFTIGRTRAWSENDVRVWKDFARLKARATAWLQNYASHSGRIEPRQAKFFSIFKEGRVARNDLIEFRRYLEDRLDQPSPVDDVQQLLQLLDGLLPELYWLRQRR